MAVKLESSRFARPPCTRIAALSVLPDATASTPRTVKGSMSFVTIATECVWPPVFSTDRSRSSVLAAPPTTASNQSVLPEPTISLCRPAPWTSTNAFICSMVAPTL